MRPASVACVLAASWALLAAGCGEERAADRAADRPPSVLLITLDTTRADRLGAYGHAAAQTPALDGLAARGLLFERAWSPAPLTLPSHATILTGLYPVEHGARDNTLFRVGEPCELLSEALAAEGWRTGAFVSSVVLARKYGLGQGFEVYRGVSGAAAEGEGEAPAGRPTGERPASAVVDDALDWLGGVGPDEHWFAWLHFYDPHEPRQPPEPFASRLADAYDAEIAYTDSQIARLLDELARLRPQDAPLIVVTADHGESLGQHGEASHSTFIYDATQRVPLLLVLPDGRRAGERVATPVSVADIVPTILDVLGLPREAMAAVRTPSLLASADRSGPGPSTALGAAGGGGGAGADAVDPDAPGPGRALYLETLNPFHEHHWQPLRGVVWMGAKLIDSTRPELYALESDPREEHDLAPTDPELVAELRARLARLLAVHSARVDAAAAAAPAPGAAELDTLSALGYVGGTQEGDPFDPSLPLPRDRVHILGAQVAAHELLTRGLERLAPDAGSGDPAARRAEAEALLGQARAAFLELSALEPHDRQTAIGLANLEMALGRYEAAREPLERYALALPRDPRARFPLAQCYAETGHVEWGLAEMAKAVHLDPQFRAAYLWLAETHAQRGEPGAAAWWLLQLEAAPGHRASPELGTRIAALREAAQRRGQPIAPPPFALDSSPAPDVLTPEGRRADAPAREPAGAAGR